MAHFQAIRTKHISEFKLSRPLKGQAPWGKFILPLQKFIGTPLRPFNQVAIRECCYAQMLDASWYWAH